MLDSLLAALKSDTRIQALIKSAGENNSALYLVGGAIRDWLLPPTLTLSPPKISDFSGTPLPHKGGGDVISSELTPALSKDLDFILIHQQPSGKAEPLARQIADQYQGSLVNLDPEFGIHRVVFPDGLNLDIADALDNDLQVDLARRDLTVNAMALSLHFPTPLIHLGLEVPSPLAREGKGGGTLIDPFQGETDLSNRCIRMIRAENLHDDPLRMLRVFRVAASIQAKVIDADTVDVIRKAGNTIWTVAAERIQYEFFRLLGTPSCFPYLEAMAECGLLETLIPDLTPMRAIGSSGFHHLGLFEHTMEVVRQTERLIEECPVPVQEWIQQPLTSACNRLGMVKLAALLHDIGKPATMGKREDVVHGERLTFYGHEMLGETMAEPLLKRWKVSHEVMNYIQKLIRWHLYPCQFGPDSPRKSVLRFYRRMGQETLDVVLLALADRHSACGAWLSPEDFEASHQAHLWLMENYTTEQPTLNMPRLLNGHEVMQLLNIPPGPQIKTILEALQEAQQLNEVSSAEEAKEWVKVHYTVFQV